MSQFLGCRILGAKTGNGDVVTLPRRGLLFQVPRECSLMIRNLVLIHYRGVFLCDASPHLLEAMCVHRKTCRATTSRASWPQRGNLGA